MSRLTPYDVPGSAALLKALDDVLVCPACAAPLQPDESNQTLVCSADGKRRAACRDGMLDFVSPEQDDRGTLTGFGFQWARVLPHGPGGDTIAYNNSLQDLEQRIPQWLGLSPTQLQGLRSLDIGCGHGLYSLALSKLGSQTLGVDLSESVYRLTRERLVRWREHPLQYIRADVFNLPLAKHAFDIVLSFGMAHHTPDPKRAVFESAARVAPGGRMLLYVYEPWRVGHVTMRKLFPFPRWLPKPALHQVCRLLAVPIWLYLSMRRRLYPSRRLYDSTVLGLFDVYSPRYVFTYRPHRITAWLREAGFSVAERVDKCIYLATK